MRSLALILLALLWVVSVHANDINISTIEKDGSTLFYLQAGAFNLEKDAKTRKKELSGLVKEPVIIKNLADKSLYLVQIGPIKEYQTARQLKDRLSQKTDSKKNKLQSSPNPSKGQTSPPPLASESKLWNLRNADIRAVIAEVSRITGKNFIIDPRVQGKISIISSTPMTDKELYQVFLSVLQVSGYAAIPNGEVIKIIPNIDAKTLSPDMNNPPEGEDMMVSVVPVNYVPADQLVPVLRPLMPQWSNVSAYSPSNMLILSGRANNIRSLTRIISQVDSSDSSGVDVVRLRYALAMDIATTMKELVKVPAGIQGRNQISIAADDKSNSILISGSKTDRIRTRLLLLQLDKKSGEGLNSTTQVVYLNFLRAEDLVPILAGVAQANFSGTVGKIIGTVTVQALDSTMPASMLAAGSTGGGGTSQPSSNASPSVASSAATANTSQSETKTEGSTKPTVQIIAEPNTNSIILSAPASIIQTLKMVIRQLDIRPAQILIEAMVAEINEKDFNDLGIEWGSLSQSRNISAFRQGFAIINSKVSTADFQAQIYALATEQKANILSTPSVVVLDNRQAKIAVGQQISVAASTAQSNVANGTPFTTFNRLNVTLHIYVRPQITKGDGIQMQIDQGNDTVDPLTAISGNPVINTSAIVTSVHVESGDIIVLGGLTKDDLSNDNNRLPILGDIPGLGKLFQHNKLTRQKKVLMVFIKPIILHNEQQTVMASNEKYYDTRQYQLDWARSQDAYNSQNTTAVMPPIQTANLPKPFNRVLQRTQVGKPQVVKPQVSK